MSKRANRYKQLAERAGPIITPVIVTADVILVATGVVRASCGPPRTACPS
ncbi:MAG: hypothetical protein ACYDH5_14205 [Acidimicrobiales bacterium]